MDKVDATMATVNEQRDLANEVAEAISNPAYNNMDLDEVGVVFLHILTQADRRFLG